MREIWRRTWSLFFNRSVLWLPVLCAEFLSSWLWRLQRLAAADLIHWLILHTSLFRLTVSGGRPWEAWHVKLAFITSPFVFGTYFLNVCLYATALVVTAKLVEASDRDVRPDFLVGLRAARVQLRRILGFSLKFFLCYVPAAIGAFEGLRLVLRDPLHYDPLLVRALNSALSLVTYLVVAYFLTPSALLLLRDSPLPPLERDSVRWGRVFSFAAVIVILAVGYLANVAEQTLLESHFIPVFPHLMMSLAVSLLCAFPYIPLFIALSLIATSDAQEPELVPVVSES